MAAQQQFNLNDADTADAVYIQFVAQNFGLANPPQPRGFDHADCEYFPPTTTYLLSLYTNLT